MPLVSIIVPVYNVEAYLYRCIENILNQTYSDFELILVDDGSPDKCSQICDEYAQKDSRIKVIHKRNGGQSSARNTGLEICRGEYIYFCDSDDWIEPNLLELTIDKITNEDADMVRFQCFTHFDDAVYQSSFLLNRNSVALEDDQAKLDFICQSLLSYKIGWELCLAVYKADTIIKNNVRFPQGIDIAEDLFINILDTVYARKIAFLDEPLYHYCMRGDSTMGKVKGTIRMNECNELAFRLYKEIENEYIKSNFYRIHNIMALNELMGHLPAIENYSTAKLYLETLDTITNMSFFNNQLRLATQKVDYVKMDGFYMGCSKNALNAFLLNGSYLQYARRMAFRFFVYLPIRVLRKIKRVLRI